MSFEKKTPSWMIGLGTGAQQKAVVNHLHDCYAEIDRLNAIEDMHLEGRASLQEERNRAVEQLELAKASYIRGLNDGRDEGIKEAPAPSECVCAETNSRNCPVHTAPTQGRPPVEELLEEESCGVRWMDAQTKITLRAVSAYCSQLETRNATLTEALGKISYLDYHQDGECKNDDPERCIGHIAHKAINAIPPAHDSEAVEGLQKRIVEPEWLLIETAPKDGTKILVLHKSSMPFAYTVYWRKYFDGSEGWSMRSGDEVGAHFWLPLPPAPKTGDKL